MAISWQPDLSVLLAIAANGSLGGWGTPTAGTNLFGGPERAEGDGIPAKAIFVLETGGMPVEGFVNGRASYDYESSVQVIVRGDRNGFSAGQTAARALASALHDNSYFIGEGYVWARVQESSPNFFGFTDAELPRWSFNMHLLRKG